jgi:hypothetical protein
MSRPLPTWQSFALAVSSLVLLSVTPVGAQVSDSHSDGNDARYDAMYGTPNSYTPTSQDNLFATTPGLEQQASRSQFTANGLVPLSFNTNAGFLPSGGSNTAEFDPQAGISWTTPIANSPLKFTANVRAEFDRFTADSGFEFDKLRVLGRLQYVDADNDQAYSPYVSYVPRWDFTPLFDNRFALRQDVNVGFNKVFNYDANFQRVPFGSSTSTDTVWSFGLTSFFQARFRDPAPGSFAVVAIPSVSYVISPQWNVSGGFEIERRQFDGVNLFTQRDWFFEPITTLEFVLPSAWFGSAASLVGRPALDFQIAYERNWSNLPAASYTIWHAGAGAKFGWRF